MKKADQSEDKEIKKTVNKIDQTKSLFFKDKQIEQA